MATRSSVLAMDRGAWQVTVHGVAKSQTCLEHARRHSGPTKDPCNFGCWDLRWSEGGSKSQIVTLEHWLHIDEIR